MLKNKSIKIAFVWLCVVTLLMPYISQVTAVENLIGETTEVSEVGKITESTSQAELISIFPRNGEKGYKINSYGILKIVNSKGTETEDNFYCLEPNKSFPEAETKIYNNIGDLEKLSIEKIAAYKNELGEEKYNSILWLSKNICMQESSEETINSYIEKVFGEYIKCSYEIGEQFKDLDGKYYDGSSSEEEYKSAYVQFIRNELTEEDINVAQQLALWYITNPTDNKYYPDTYLGNNKEYFPNGVDEEKFKNGYYAYEAGDGLSTDKKIEFLYQLPSITMVEIPNIEYDMNSTTALYINILYNYLVTNAKKADSNKQETGLFLTDPEIDKNIKPVATITEDDSHYVVGPFKINTREGRYVDKELYDIKLSVENYEIYEDKECTKKIEAELDDILDKEYYVKVDSNINPSKVTLSVEYKAIEKRVATVWEPKESKYQKVILITKEQITKDPQAIVVPLEKGDLSLRKYIVSVNGIAQNRTPSVNLNGLLDGTASTAIYNHKKNAIEVECGDTIVYQINVYNEGTIDAIVKEITDYLPQGLTFVQNSEINSKYGWQISEDGRQAKTNILADTNLLALDIEDEAMTSAFVQIECKVDENLKAESVLTNVAEITADNIKDRDSSVKSIDNKNINDTFAGNPSNKEDLSDSNYFYKGLEDDDDFEKVIINGDTFDLNLKKFITKINGKALNTSREPVVDTTDLKNGKTDAIYKTVKTPLVVESGDVVKYTLRVYNESTISGYAEEVADYLPEGLGLLVNYNDNIDNYWSVTTATSAGAKTIKLSDIENGTKNLKIDDFTGETKLEDATVLVGKGAKITSAKLSSSKESNLISKYDGKSDKLNYKDIEVTCIVISDELKDGQLKNIAEITKDSDENKQEVEDRDSVPGTIDVNNYPGDDKNQDDNDYENLTQEEKIFDLSLQKFITGLNNEKITDRVPTITKNIVDGKFKYNHNTEPLSVANTDLVTYTIRVYNEGEKAGYAKEVQDDIPEGLIFVTDNETNIKYGWKMYDKYGKETSDINQATNVKTTYLSKQDSEARNENTLLEAYDETKKTPDYADVQIVFKVDDSKIEKTTTTDKRVIINTAEISDDSDENGYDVEDNDSVPSNGKENEDDIDTEKIYVKYFDLALEKHLSKIIITEDGKTREIIATDKESLLKVEIHRKKIKSTVVKFMYDITVTNEGEIEGYTTEVKDYVPEGLMFVAEDNEDWTEVSPNIITTNALAKTLLKPNDSATVQVTLTWMNSEDNLGTKVNVAEISEDYNEKGDTSDIDSTPDNKVDGEDDIDDAPVMLTISTGSAPTYIGLTFTVTTILATGIILIKKFVL